MTLGADDAYFVLCRTDGVLEVVPVASLPWELQLVHVLVVGSMVEKMILFGMRMCL